MSSQSLLIADEKGEQQFAAWGFVKQSRGAGQEIHSIRFPHSHQLVRNYPGLPQQALKSLVRRILLYTLCSLFDIELSM